jgi:multimeric flavodoxin WrbA
MTMRRCAEFSAAICCAWRGRCGADGLYAASSDIKMRPAAMAPRALGTWYVHMQNPPQPQVRTGQEGVPVSKDEFARRFRALFLDPAFRPHDAVITQLLEAAWNGHLKARKSPVTRRAGDEYADPDYELSVEWLAAREAIHAAQRAHDRRDGKPRFLLICGSPRNDQTCPGEMSKSYRLMGAARTMFDDEQVDIDMLDLSALASEYGRVIHPCKACVSTAMPLCHWPCSCYPNHSLGQVRDWMNDLYPRWVAAHGVLIVTPVHWYQAPSALKLMIDRLVCADGGNPDPTSTHGKDPALAKAMEMRGWNYPRHLAGRAFAVIVHGDTAGAETLRRSLADWLSDLGLVQAGKNSCIDRYVGYYGTYAASHEALDEDDALFAEVRNAAQALQSAVTQRRSGVTQPDEGQREPRPK